MLRSLKQIYGKTLGASDGDIGHLVDFYFDDHKWVIRYLIVDTGQSVFYDEYGNELTDGERIQVEVTPAGSLALPGGEKAGRRLELKTKNGKVEFQFLVPDRPGHRA